MQITIASIELKETRSAVITTEGRRLGVWTDKMGKLDLVEGGTYEVETQSKEFNGKTLTNIVNAKRIEAPLQPADPVVPPPRPSGNGQSEQIFVVALLKSLIEAGEVKNDKKELWETTKMLRGLWAHTFGPAIFTPSDAGLN